MRPFGPVGIVEGAQNNHVSHLLIHCFFISVLAIHKYTVYCTIVHRKLPGFVDTKVSKFYPIIRPLFCSIGDDGCIDGRHHDKYIFGIIYLFSCIWFYQSIFDLDITQ